VNSSRAGSAGEQIAASFLIDNGYRVTERNFRKPSGEVDIIAIEGGTIAFCEVKSWERMPISGLEHALSRRKQGRIVRTSLWFLQEHPEFADFQPRFDVLFVSHGSVEHLKNAFGGHGAL
jgi:putative endonuclease